MIVALINSWACPAGKILVGRFHLSDLDQRLCRIAGSTVGWCDTKNGAASLNRAILWLQLAKAFRMKISEKNESTAVDVAGNLWQLIGWIESTPVAVTNPVPRLNHATARTQTFQNP